MQLQDAHFNYPDNLAPADVVSRVARCLAAVPANHAVWTDPNMHWENYITRASFEWGVHPIWPLISLQRERQLFTKPGTQRDFEFAEGVVGKDGPGTTNELHDGLPLQIMLSVRTAAWLGGIGPDADFGFRNGLFPNAPRWKGKVGQLVQLYDLATHNPSSWHPCSTMAEFIQLSFTPHLETLDENSGIYAARIAPIF